MLNCVNFLQMARQLPRFSPPRGEDILAYNQVVSKEVNLQRAACTSKCPTFPRMSVQSSLIMLGRGIVPHSLQEDLLNPPQIRVVQAKLAQ